MILLFLTLSISCKEEVESPTNQIQQFEELKAFLSITLNIPKDKIKYNKELKQFSVPNTVFRASLNDVQKRYESSNEYQFQFQNKGK